VSVFKMVFKMEAWIPCDFYSMQTVYTAVYSNGDTQ